MDANDTYEYYYYDFLDYDDFVEISSVKMSREAFASVNVPVSIFSIVLNIALVFCLIFPRTGTERPKRLLTVLLGLLVGCNITAGICSLFMVFNNFSYSFLMSWDVPTITVYTMMMSVSSSHWLNVFYCFNIIPVQRQCFMWLKKNLAVFMFSTLIVTAAVYLLGISVSIMQSFIVFNNNNGTGRINVAAFYKACAAGMWMKLSLFLFSLCVMLLSSCTTAVFLWRHMKNVEMSSCSGNQRNIMVIIISITVQAVLHVICSAFVVVDELLVKVFFLYFNWNANISCTVISLYFLGTSINIGVSQSLFRQRVVHAWQKCFRPHSSLSEPHTISSEILTSQV